MPSDASIYSLIQTPKQELPLDTAGKAMTIRAMMNQNALSGLQQQQTALSLDEQKKLRDVFASNPNPTVAEVMAASPTAGMQYQKFQLDKQLTGAKLSKAEADALAARATDARNSLAGVQDQASYDQWLQYARSKGYQIANSAPAQYNPDWQKQHLYTADKLLDQLNQKGVVLNTGGTTGLVNPQTGEPIGPRVPMTMTPGEAATLPFTRGNYNINRARATYEGIPGLDGIGNPTLGPAPAAPVAATPAPAAVPTAPVATPASAAAPQAAPPMKTQDLSKLTPQARDKIIAQRAADQPKDVTSLEDMYAKTDQATDLAKAILAHPGLGWATGATGMAARNIPGTAAYDAGKLIDTLKSQVMLSQLQSFRAASANGSSGFGQLSNAEGDTLRNAITNLDPNQSEAQFKKALQNVIDTNNAIKDRMARGYERLYGASPPLKSYHTNPMTPTSSAPPGGLSQADIDAELRRRGVIK